MIILIDSSILDLILPTWSLYFYIPVLNCNRHTKIPGLCYSLFEMVVKSLNYLHMIWGTRTLDLIKVRDKDTIFMCVCMYKTKLALEREYWVILWYFTLFGDCLYNSRRLPKARIYLTNGLDLYIYIISLVKRACQFFLLCSPYVLCVGGGYKKCSKVSNQLIFYIIWEEICIES